MKLSGVINDPAGQQFCFTSSADTLMTSSTGCMHPVQCIYI